LRGSEDFPEHGRRESSWNYPFLLALVQPR
jgi:hypothetical protein